MGVMLLTLGTANKIGSEGYKKTCEYKPKRQEKFRFPVASHRLHNGDRAPSG